MKSRFRQSITLAGIICCILAVVNPLQARTVYSEGTTLRSSLVLTTSDVYSTATVGDDGYTHENFYIYFTKGDLTSVSVKVVAAYTDSSDPGPTDYVELLEEGTSITLTASGNYLLQVPRESIGAARYLGVVSKGTGTVTSSLLAVKRRSYGVFPR